MSRKGGNKVSACTRKALGDRYSEHTGELDVVLPLQPVDLIFRVSHQRFNGDVGDVEVWDPSNLDGVWFRRSGEIIQFQRRVARNRLVKRQQWLASENPMRVLRFSPQISKAGLNFLETHMHGFCPVPQGARGLVLSCYQFFQHVMG